MDAPETLPTKLLTGAPVGGKRAPRWGLPLKAQETQLARTDLGEKQICPSCGARFYDLSKRPAVCPKCTTAFDPAEDAVRTRRTRSRVSPNDPIYKDDEDEVDAKKKKGGDDDEDEDEEEGAEETAALDSEDAAVEPITDDDDDEDDSKKSSDDELPEGFSEEEADLGDDAADDDSVPMIEDDEEFSEDELGVPGGDDENER